MPQPAALLPGISVIVCCYNSATRLPLTVKHLACQNISDTLPYEIVIVDNNSGDNTSAVATELIQTYPKVSIRLVEEPRPGLAYARITGSKAATYSTLLFCDDDNLLDADYVSTAYSIMQANPSIGVLGGIGEAASESGDPLPEWFAAYSDLYAIGAQKPQHNKHVYGAGMVVPKALFLAIYASGYEFICVGRTGTSLSSGEDTEMCYIIHMLGYKLQYDERLKFIHKLAPSRLTKEYLHKLQKGIGYSFIQLQPYRYLMHGKKADEVVWLKDMLVFGISVLKNWLGLNKTERSVRLSMLHSYWNLKGQYKAKEQQILKSVNAMKSSVLQQSLADAKNITHNMS